MCYTLCWRIDIVERYNHKEDLHYTQLQTLILSEQQYPITGSLMKPASNPTHYEDLMRELVEAPERSWWGRMTNRWKGFLRFQ
jgi:hypothetical protein